MNQEPNFNEKEQDEQAPVDELSAVNEQSSENEQPPASEPAEPLAKRAASSVFEIVEMFAWAVFIVLIVFTFFLRLCRVDGGSMENTLYDKQNLLLYSFNYTPEQDDIIVFHLTNPEDNLEKTMVKRVIATGGQTVEINFKTATITVDGVEYADSHAVLKDRFTDKVINRYTLTAEHHYDPTTQTFSATVPEGHVFVMGDNRNNSKDGRDADVGFIDERCILGKAICRIAPFTFY